MMKRAVAVHNSSSVSELGSFVTSRPGDLDANLGELLLSPRLPMSSIICNFVLQGPKKWFAKCDKHYPSRFGQTSLATAVTNFTKPCTSHLFGLCRSAHLYLGTSTYFESDILRRSRPSRDTYRPLQQCHTRRCRSSISQMPRPTCTCCTGSCQKVPACLNFPALFLPTDLGSQCTAHQP